MVKEFTDKLVDFEQNKSLDDFSVISGGFSGGSSGGSSGVSSGGSSGVSSGSSGSSDGSAFSGVQSYVDLFGASFPSDFTLENGVPLPSGYTGLAFYHKDGKTYGVSIKASDWPGYDPDGLGQNIPGGGTGEEGDPDHSHRDAVDAYNQRGTLFNVWQPNPDLSPEENLAQLTAYINNLFNASTFPDSALLSGSFFSNILMAANEAATNFAIRSQLDASSKAALVEKIADLSWNFISSQYQAALNYQSWYLQQEYNSPVNMINRLSAAGLSSAFVFNPQAAGNSQSPAASPQMSVPQPSGAGQIQQQQDQSELNALIGGLSSAASFLPAIGGTVANLVNTFANKRLTMKQLQLADQQLLNDGATFDNLRLQHDQMSLNMGLQMFDKVMASSKQTLDQAQMSVDTAKENLSQARDLYQGYTEVLGYRVKVRTKSGNTEYRELTSDQTAKVIQDRGVLEDGSTVIGVSSWDRIEAQKFDMSAKISTPGPIGVDAGASYGVSSSEGQHGSESNQRSNKLTRENTSSSTTGSNSEKYDKNGKSFTIGDTTFESVTLHVPFTLPQHKAYIDSCLKKYQDALDHYNTLYTGEKAKLCELSDNIMRNLGSFNAKLNHKLFMDRINGAFKPKVYVPD